MLVSCLTPTADRREFWPRCLRCFLLQDYPALEWVIVDNGSDPIKDLLPPDPRIRYIRVPGPRLRHGALMNRAMESATGPVAIVLDDDDWYAPDRVSRQARPLEGAGVDICGTGRLYYYLHGQQRAFVYRNMTKRPWLAAPAFRRSLWEARRFDDLVAGADTSFQRRIPPERQRDLDDLGLLVSTVHPRNAAPKRMPSASFVAVPWGEVMGVTGGTLL